ncbi:19536_t:CDS:2, partial [Racocetra persica]
SEEDNNRKLVNMINAELVSLNNHNSLISDKLNTFEELLKNEELIADTRFFYHETHPTLVLGEEYLSDITNTPTAENNLIIIE